MAPSGRVVDEVSRVTKVGGLEGAEIVVPASIGNVGSGFDTLSVAVRLYLRLRISTVKPKAPGSLVFRFLDQQLHGENYIERAFRYVAERVAAVGPNFSSGVRSDSDAPEPARLPDLKVGPTYDTFPGLIVDVKTDIPMCAGLGSSAAATVAGLRLYELVTGHSLSQDQLLRAACELDGHPDNTSAALLGGLVGSCVLADGRVLALSTKWPESIRFAILTPDLRLSTSAARGVLPESYSRGDAIFNLQRVALLLQALEHHEYSLLREALRDRWHQPYRQPLVPGLELALALEHPNLLGVCLSGAGPSIVALAEEPYIDEIEGLLSGSYAPLGIPFQVRILTAHQERRAVPRKAR